MGKGKRSGSQTSFISGTPAAGGEGGGKDRKLTSGRARTRSQKPKLIDDTEVEDKILGAQLRGMGLYEAPTLGDGNCAFRALSDQLFGSSSLHARLRKEICDYVESRPDRYKLFVDEDSISGGFEGHVRSMRNMGTYGTHIELSACAQIYRRPIKVIQAGLVYVIQFDASEPPFLPIPSTSTAISTSTSSLQLESLNPEIRSSTPSSNTLEIISSSKPTKGKIKSTKLTKLSKKERDRLATLAILAESGMESERNEPVYIAYHTWEHYQSVRMLTGPHTGVPRVRETSTAREPDRVIEEESRRVVKHAWEASDEEGLNESEADVQLDSQYTMQDHSNLNLPELTADNPLSHNFSRFKNHHHRSLSLDHDSPNSPSPSTPNSIEASSPSAAEGEGEEGDDSPDELAIVPVPTTISKLRNGAERRGLGRSDQETSLRLKTKIVGGRRIGNPISGARTGGGKPRILTRRERKIEEKERVRDRPSSGSGSGAGGKEVEMLRTLFI